MRARQAACALTLAVVLASVAASPAAGAIALRGAPTSAAVNASWITLAKPTGVVTGDVMLASITRGGTAAVTPPAGWTLLRSDTAASGRMMTFVKVAAAGEGTSYSFTFGGTVEAAGAIMAYSGVDSTSPVDAVNGATAGSGAAIVPSVTTTYLRARRVAFAAMIGNVAITFTGVTKQFERSSTNFRVAGGDSTHVAPGATGTASATGGTGGWVAQAVALNEAPELTATLPTTSYSFSALQPGGVNESSDQVTTVTSNRVWSLKIRDTAGNGGRMRQWTGSAFGAGLLNAPLQWRLRTIDGAAQATSFADITGTSAGVVSGQAASATPTTIGVRYRQPLGFGDARLPAGQDYRTSVEYDAAHGF